jgi:hypothetical protein
MTSDPVSTRNSQLSIWLEARFANSIGTHFLIHLRKGHPDMLHSSRDKLVRRALLQHSHLRVTDRQHGVLRYHRIERRSKPRADPSGPQQTPVHR